MKAAIITVGDELIQGFTIDSNASWLSHYLTDNNIEVLVRICVSDNENAIISSFNHLYNNYNPTHIIITGGLGPTHDDITKKVLSDYLGVPLELDDNYLLNLKSKFKKNNLPLPSNIQSQALMIKGSISIKNKSGTALGLIINKNKSKIIVLPGVPSEMKQMVQDSNIFKNKNKPLYITLNTTGIYESKLYDLLKETIDENKKKFKLAFLAKYSGVNIRISKKDSLLTDSDLIRFKEAIYKVIDKYIYSDKNETIQHVVVNILKEKNLTLSVAESCTGGLISKKITDVPGASHIYKGGLVAYSNYLKIKLLDVDQHIIEKYGSVSREVAESMAEGIKNKTKSNISISTTGISGPSGGSKEKELGVVYIAVSYNNEIIVKKFNLIPKRNIHREISSSIALNMIRNIIK